MLVSVAAGALPFYPIRSALDVVRRSGADGVELLLSRRLLRRSPEEIQHLAGQVGIRILSAHAHLSLRQQSIERKTACDIASIRLAGALPTCDAIVLHPPLSGPRLTSELSQWLDSISNVREQVRPGMKLALENRVENFDGVEPQWLDDLTRLRGLASEWGMHVCLDLAHAASFGIDVRDAVEAVLPRLGNVHVSDTRERQYRSGLANGLFRDHAVPGTGTLPLGEVVELLARRGYTGPLTVELSPVALQTFVPGGPCRILKMTVDALRQQLSTPDGRPTLQPEPRRQPF